MGAHPVSRPGGPGIRMLATTLGVGTFVTYMVGSSRAFGYDAAVTMEHFVAGPPSWALTRQIVFNNHPAFSLIEGLIADVGGTSEVVMRIAPTAFAAITVTLLAWRLGERWGWRAGLSGGVILAVHPLLVPLARDARGYSLAVLAIVVMGLAVFDIPRPWLFGLAAAVGLGTHLYVAVPFAALTTWLILGPTWSRLWRAAAVGGFVGGVLFYAGMLHDLGRGGREFRPRFPIDATRALLGDGIVPTITTAALLVLALSAVTIDRRRVAMATVLVAGVVAPWLLGPTDLYPRFVYWAVPAVAVAVAWAVHRAPATLVLVGIVVIGCIEPQIDGWSRDDTSNRLLAEHAPDDACAVTYTYEAVRWYASLTEGFDCPTVALLNPESTEPETTTARRRWPEVCWESDQAEVRGKTEADCQPDT